jgi:periplasmic divalent cation tolerance protein
MDRPLLVYTTFPDRETGEAIAEALVREGLAACVNLLPGMRSVYAWKGAVERADEVVGIVKTRAGLREAVGAAIKARHPYDTPIVLFLEPSGGDAATLAWLLAETGAAWAGGL